MTSPILDLTPLGRPPWPTDDPFLFCVHHLDAYPAGTEGLGVEPALLRGRQLGMDFSGKDGWSMYHGNPIPGFPQHPHRGFETVTLARRGFIDHSDSLGATARFGKGDVQWMTAGGGIVHCEMFPLLEREQDNTAELFQIWLNLPAKDKLVDPYFTMFWSETLPTLRPGGGVEVDLVAGTWEGAELPAPPPSSWAADPQNAVAIATIRIPAGASWTLPPAGSGVGRSVYAITGEPLVAGQPLAGKRARLEGSAAVGLGASADAEVLLLQGRPIAEPVAQHGPFVMNSFAELQQAFDDYRKTEFGGWPWPSDGPVHPRAQGRFAIHADGRQDGPPG